MSSSQTQLSPGAALALGVVVIAAGVAPILGALGVLPLPLSEGVPVWVGVCAGMLFVLAGLAMINGYAVGGKTMDGTGADAAAEPFRYAVQAVLGVAICAMFAAIAAWVGFGPGERHFTGGVNLPLVSQRGATSEWLGRAVFGGGAILTGLMAVVFAVGAVRRSKR